MNNPKNSGLPKNAKRVFKGVIFDVYQWKQKMFDGSTAIFEKLKRPNTASVIAVVGDKILIQEEQQPDGARYLAFPGGRTEEGESDLDAAKRELLEESGYASDDVILWKEFMPSPKIIRKIIYFIARNAKLIEKPKPDRGEKIEYKLVSFDELIMLSENELFAEKDIVPMLLRMRLHPEEKEEFRKLLFKK
jgi:8-oxo-dGTP pyrophosphatase MutT (NUDIX family)